MNGATGGCPNCGYCPHCGRSNPQQNFPQNPYFNPQYPYAAPTTSPSPNQQLWGEQQPQWQQQVQTFNLSAGATC